jgi:hypothetical protein
MPLSYGPTRSIIFSSAFVQQRRMCFSYESLNKACEVWPFIPTGAGQVLAAVAPRHEVQKPSPAHPMPDADRRLVWAVMDFLLELRCLVDLLLIEKRWKLQCSLQAPHSHPEAH